MARKELTTTIYLIVNDLGNEHELQKGSEMNTNTDAGGIFMRLSKHQGWMLTESVGVLKKGGSLLIKTDKLGAVCVFSLKSISQRRKEMRRSRS